jgi:hypothetical protein
MACAAGSAAEALLPQCCRHPLLHRSPLLHQLAPLLLQDKPVAAVLPGHGGADCTSQVGLLLPD